MEAQPKKSEEKVSSVENHEVLNFPNGDKRESTYVHPVTGDKTRTLYGADGKPSREGHFNADGELEYWLEYTNNAIDPIEHRVDASTTLEDLTRQWGEEIE